MTKPKAEIFLRKNGIYKIDYYERGDYWIGFIEKIFPIVKRFIYPQTFYFKYDEQ